MTQLKLAAPARRRAQQAGYRAAIARTRRSSPIRRQKKENCALQAEADQKTYDALNYRDDQFDLSDALMAMAISLLALTALTHKPWLYWLALVPPSAAS